ncbi:hypothetical protein B0P06_002899 [Clostridium saccharoperbutylacetonicum]|uniref:Putative metal-dependent hydrolase with the TIM-barrel fold n=1 Tax=Clostridium saccharoperbutylacetonicum N1-4(HMT) TaxID=931276 RepID=M1MW08_9CLOT|nr:metal-dependent hydrolase [Clostridium saccharoperbutylacetonicum]AGF58781.1 putative metal-dependent hydrolase with the TIM-barrel fold [Clostridium saccharoperbutylacetonicum N1-4(HMT)]NRT60439.1 hypothetical protein [Clostridium saccharoperbutylacetonicum]NSB23752.1 hypothetical protein [Clostridium saccharoperbutylacetonicum]NSB43128.1 hypothetical protein [Clostridium saccharoperbutylacetonicum]
MSIKKSTQSPTYADMILCNGKIVTVDDEFKIAEAVAIIGDTILAVGENEEMKLFEGPQTEIINLQGKTVIPGLIDSHLHASMCAKEINNLNISEV